MRRFVLILLVALVASCGNTTDVCHSAGVIDRIQLAKTDTTLVVGQRLALTPQIVGAFDACGGRITNPPIAVIVLAPDQGQMRGAADTIWSLVAQDVTVYFASSPELIPLSTLLAHWVAPPAMADHLTRRPL